MKFPALALLVIPLSACSSAPAATPADATHIADAADAQTDPCGGLCGIGTVCAEGRCVAFDAGVDALVDALRPVDAMDVAEDRGSDAPMDTGCPAHADRLPSGGCACVIGYRICGDVCRELDTDPANCGACGNVCDGGVCVAGRCAAIIPPIDVLASDATTPDAATDSDPCGGACADRPHTTMSECHATGACLVWCADGWGDCDTRGSNGCETDLSAHESCGGCSVRCADTSFCWRGVCRR